MVFQFQPRNNIDAFYLLCLNKTTHYFTVERTSIGLESLLYICFYIITDFVFIFELVPCKSCHFNNLLTEAGVMHEAGYVDSIWST